MKLFRYIEEIKFDLMIAADFKSALSLAAATLKFHFANLPAKIIKKRLWYNKTGVFNIKIGCRPVSIKLRPYAGDMFIFYEVFMDRVYKIPNLPRFNAVKIVDLGAHVGLATLFFADLFPKAEFICIEPSPDNVKLLKYNLSCLKDRARIVEGAIGNGCGEAVFDQKDASWKGSLAEGRAQGKKVRCYDINEVIKIFGLQAIDILKVDIEGAEKFVFANKNGWLEKVKLILIELHSYSSAQFQKDVMPYKLKVFTPNSVYGNNITMAANTAGLI